MADITDDEKLRLMMNRNIKLAPSLMALTWDVMFVWTINVMFLTQVKGVSYSNTVLLDSFLMIFGVIGCVMVDKLFQNIKPTLALRIGLLFYALYLLLMMLGTHYATFVIAQLGIGFGYAFCGIKINTFLNDTLVIAKRPKEFSEISGKGMGLVYLIEGLGAIFITYVYNLEPYAAFVISLLIVIASYILTFFAVDTNKYMKRNIKLNANSTASTSGTLKFKKPKGVAFFMACTLLVSFFLRGAAASVSAGYKIYLQQIQDAGITPVWMFGYLFAISRVFAALMSKSQSKSNSRYGIRSVAGFILLAVVCFFSLSALLLSNAQSYFVVGLTSLLFSVLFGIRPAVIILMNKYSNDYNRSEDVDSAMSKKMMFEYMGSALGSFVFSQLLAYFNDDLGMSLLMFSVIFVIPLLICSAFFLRSLFVMFKNKRTIVKKEYTED